MTNFENARFGEAITEKKYVMENVFPALRPTKAKKKLEDEIGIPFLDLELYFRVAVVDPDGNDGSYILTERVLKKTGLKLGEIKRLSKLNANVVVQSLGELVNAEEDNSLYVLTSERKTHGAGGAMVATEMLSALAKSLGENELFIIPSSIHEILAIPCKGMDEKGINEIIQTINKNEVADEEILSDHVYIFNATTQEFAFTSH